MLYVLNEKVCYTVLYKYYDCLVDKKKKIIIINDL